MVHAATYAGPSPRDRALLVQWTTGPAPLSEAGGSMEKATRADRVSAVLAGDPVLLAPAPRSPPSSCRIDPSEGTRMSTWTPDELARIGDAEELRVASYRRDGTLRKYVIIWVAREGDDIYVRVRHTARERMVRPREAAATGRIRAGGVERDVTFVDAGLRGCDARGGGFRVPREVSAAAAQRGRHGRRTEGGEDAAARPARLSAARGREAGPPACVDEPGLPRTRAIAQHGADHEPDPEQRRRDARSASACSSPRPR